MWVTSVVCPHQSLWASAQFAPGIHRQLLHYPCSLNFSPGGGSAKIVYSFTPPPDPPPRLAYSAGQLASRPAPAVARRPETRGYRWAARGYRWAARGYRWAARGYRWAARGYRWVARAYPWAARACLPESLAGYWSRA